MKNFVLAFLLFCLLPLTGCAVGQVFWVSQSTLDSDQFGQQMRIGQIRSEINSTVEVFLGKTLIYPDEGIGRGAFVSHRTVFWRIDPKGDPHKWVRTYGEVLKPLGVQKVRVSSTLHSHHMRVSYRWLDRYGRINTREINVKIYPGDEADMPPQFEIVLVENPGRDPIRDY